MSRKERHTVIDIDSFDVTAVGKTASPSQISVAAFEAKVGSGSLFAAGDKQIRSSVSFRPETAEETGVIRRVWGDSILAEPSKVSAIVRVQHVMAEEGSRMLKSALNIGRALLDLRGELTRGEFARGLRRSAEAFRGWSPGNISKVMRVAEFIQERELAVAILPQSYSTLYEFTTLDESQLEKAKALELLRPDVRRSDVVEFKRRVAEAREAATVPSRELQKIDEKIRDLRAQLAQARRERGRMLSKKR